MSSRPNGETILARWRLVARDLNRLRGQLDHVRAGTAVADHLQSEVDRLIDEWAVLRCDYEQLVDEAAREHRSPPPEWPNAAN